MRGEKSATTKGTDISDYMKGEMKKDVLARHVFYHISPCRSSQNNTYHDNAIYMRINRARLVARIPYKQVLRLQKSHVWSLGHGLHSGSHAA
jgi:hypothetical protein